MNSPLKSPPQRVLPVLEKIKSAYIVWHGYHLTISKSQRYSIGNRIDKLFIELIEAVAGAIFLKKDEKLPYIRLSTRKLDTIKLLLQILWETKSLNTKKYIVISNHISDIGKMLGGWIKENSPY